MLRSQPFRVPTGPRLAPDRLLCSVGEDAFAAVRNGSALVSQRVCIEAAAGAVDRNGYLVDAMTLDKLTPVAWGKN